MTGLIIFFGITTVILFLLSILCAQQIGNDGSNIGAGIEWLSELGFVGLILSGIASIFIGMIRGEFHHKFEMWVLISFVISLVIFLCLLLPGIL